MCRQIFRVEQPARHFRALVESNNNHSYTNVCRLPGLLGSRCLHYHNTKHAQDTASTCRRPSVAISASADYTMGQDHLSLLHGVNNNRCSLIHPSIILNSSLPAKASLVMQYCSSLATRSINVPCCISSANAWSVRNSGFNSLCSLGLLLQLQHAILM